MSAMAMIVAQYALPEAIKLIGLIVKYEPDNVQASEWLDVLKTIQKTPADYRKEAEANIA